ncbi:hypothetical protein SynA1528_02718 [Synechococcus sp. A15-28]|nr:hypothetical protein SynA1528_02718 [Synechococcus sp. A15-28]
MKYGDQLINVLFKQNALLVEEKARGFSIHPWCYPHLFARKSKLRNQNL